jgi:hypothetical protein
MTWPSRLRHVLYAAFSLESVTDERAGGQDRDRLRQRRGRQRPPAGPLEGKSLAEQAQHLAPGSHMVKALRQDRHLEPRRS